MEIDEEEDGQRRKVNIIENEEFEWFYGHSVNPRWCSIKEVMDPVCHSDKYKPPISEVEQEILADLKIKPHTIENDKIQA